MPRLSLDTPTGAFELTEEDGHITRATWKTRGQTTGPSTGARDETPLLRRAAAQVQAYFEGARTRFDLPLRVGGTPFQQAICARIGAIPFGETVTYGDIAATLKAPPQAVGRGCGGNPIALIIPCHRVLGRTRLGGFSGGAGVETKVWLLRHEGAAGLLI